MDINIVSFTNRDTFKFTLTGISLGKGLKSDGERYDPCGRFNFITLLFDISPSILTVKNLFAREDSIILII